MENNEDQAILDEITEELKRDQFVKFVKRYQTPISALILMSIAGIVMYTSWKNRTLRELEDTTYSLVDALAVNSNKTDIVLASMSENAPAKIRPIIEIIKSGMALRNEKDEGKKKAVLQSLLDLANQNGVDIAWKDLAILVYASNAPVVHLSLSDICNKLAPLADEGRPFRLSALELLGVLYMNAGDGIKAKSYFEKLLAEKNISDAMRTRATLYKNRIAK